MQFRGPALFLDADILCLSDIAELFALNDYSKAVQVSQNKLRFEWPSVMLFNCDKCWKLTPETIDNEDFKPQALEWGSVGDLPSEWNHLVGYDEPKPAKLIHFTQGIPLFPEVRDCEYSKEWILEANKANSSVSWKELMGNSVHAKPVLEHAR